MLTKEKTIFCNLEVFSKYIIKILAGIILLCLCIFSFLFTQRCGKPLLNEIDNHAPIYEVPDNLLLNMAVLLGVVVLYVVLYQIHKKFLSKKTEKFQQRVLVMVQIMSAIFATVMSFLILQGGVRTPGDDQIQVYSAAMLFNQGNYTNLIPGGYVSMYPQQLGFIFYMQMIFRLVQSTDFYLFQVLNCFFIGGIVFVMNKCTQELSNSYVASLVSVFFWGSMLPLFLLSSWVYSDIPSFFFLFTAVYLFVRMYNRERWDSWKYIIAVVSCAVIACILRKNSLIFVIAMLIILLITLLYKKNGKLLLLVGMLSIGCFFADELLQFGYEKASGQEIDGGLPANMWIAMGMIQDESKPGWFSNYCVPVYYSVDCDRALAAESANNKILERIQNFADSPIEGISFYKRKIFTQWNDPFYNTDHLIHVDDDGAAKGITSYLLNHEDGVRNFLSGLQLLVYVGALLYVVFLNREEKLSCYLPVLIFLGGFFFSILWEANSRYVIPYALQLIPIAVVGWERMLKRYFR